MLLINLKTTISADVRSFCSRKSKHLNTKSAYFPHPIILVLIKRQKSVKYIRINTVHDTRGISVCSLADGIF